MTRLKTTNNKNKDNKIRRTKNILASIAALLPFTAPRHSDRALFIETYAFPPSVLFKLKEVHRNLSSADCALVLRGLRDWFQVCLTARGRFISMPSRMVDDAWHAFILDTAAYQRFCRRAFGRFLHHKPADETVPPPGAAVGLLRAWKYAAVLDGQDPDRLRTLPLLFAIDARLRMADGLHYSLDWGKHARNVRRRRILCSNCSGTLSRGICGSSGSCGSSSCSTCVASCSGGGCGGGD